jgi:uncharacterized protein
MRTTDSRLPSRLIVSAYRYEKDGATYAAGLDPATATVRVLAGAAPRAHDLTRHFELTTAEGPHRIARQVGIALSAAAEAGPAGGGVRTFTFMPTSRCNMGCTYCGQIHRPGSVSAAVEAQFLERVQAAFRAPDVEHVHVAWFGGEPLLAYRSVVALSSRIVEMAEQSARPYSSKMTTNGALLTPARMRRLIEDAQVSRFDITIDGPAGVHDRHRPLTAGGASFDTIVATLDWFRSAALRRPATVVLRTNVDRENVSAVGEYLRTMKELGFDDGERFLYEISPVHSWGNDVSAIALPTPEAAQREVEWMELMEQLRLPYGLLPGRPATQTCVATERLSEVIDSRGNLFSCTEYPLTPQAGSDILGNVSSEPVLDSRPRGRFDGWDEAVARGGLPCSSCELRPVCRGACPKQWSEGSVPCPTLKLNFDDRLAIFMRRHGYRVVDGR